MNLIIVTRDRTEFLIATLTSLYHANSIPLSVRIGYQGEDPSTSYAFQQVCRLLATQNVLVTCDAVSGSVASSRAWLIDKYVSDPYFAMCDDDLLFVGDVIRLNLKNAQLLNASAVGWSHVDFAPDRQFPDSDTALQGELTADKCYSLYGEVSPFRLYPETFQSSSISTQGIWSLTALKTYGVLDRWAAWPQGVRGYDVLGSEMISRQGGRVFLSSKSFGYTLNTYLQPDAAAGFWVSDLSRS